MELGKGENAVCKVRAVSLLRNEKEQGKQRQYGDSQSPLCCQINNPYYISKGHIKEALDGLDKPENGGTGAV